MFSDPSMLTMLANDYGYENAYLEVLKYHVEKMLGYLDEFWWRVGEYSHVRVIAKIMTLLMVY